MRFLVLLEEERCGDVNGLLRISAKAHLSELKDHSLKEKPRGAAPEVGLGVGEKTDGKSE
jgi:hypothetical protein